MSKSPAFPMYAADFYMDTAAWSVWEIGAYIRLLIYEWINGGIPNNIEAIARITGELLPDKNKRFRVKFERKLCDFDVKMRRILGEKFHINGNGLLVNSRMELEREKQFKYRELQAQKGKKSAEIRFNRGSTTVQPMFQPKVNSSSSSSSSNKRKIYKKKENGHVDFDEFWKAYPRKVNKREAQNRWNKAKLPELSFILKTLDEQKKSEQWQKDNGNFIPYPSTWINRERWNDEPEIKVQHRKIEMRCSKCGELSATLIGAERLCPKCN